MHCCWCCKNMANVVSQLMQICANMLQMCCVLGAVHILRQPKTGVPTPPLPPPSAMVSIWLTPPPPSVSNGQHLAYPPSPPRQPSSAFSRRPYCTTIFDVDFLT